MALPKEPRQKMINIMYLVLTALLALNVSAEILNAFKTVDHSLTTTNKTISYSTATIIKSLEEKMSEGPTAARLLMKTNFFSGSCVSQIACPRFRVYSAFTRSYSLRCSAFVIPAA